MCVDAVIWETMGCVSTERRNEATRLVIIGGGPGGYEAAIGAAQAGASVTIVERAGMGGSAVLTDVVPSKTLIATADVVRRAKHSSSFGVKIEGLDAAETDFAVVNHRRLALAKEQSADIRNGLERAGVRIIIGEG